MRALGHLALAVTATIAVAALSVAAPRLVAQGTSATTLGLMQLFSAGVIIAVAIVHMLADAAEMLAPFVPKEVVGVLFGSAFLVMFVVESVMHNEVDAHGCHDDAEDHHGHHHAHSSHVHAPCAGKAEEITALLHQPPAQRPASKGSHISHGPSSVGFLDAAEQSMKLLLALSLHALFEGLGLAAMTERKDFYMLLFAICLHKALAGVTIGVYLLKCEEPDIQMHRAVWVFAAATPIGTACGFALAHLDEVFPAAKVFSMTMSGAFVALAAGTLLYVAALEVLPHGITCCRDHQMLGFSLLIAGFGIMSTLAFVV